MNKRAYITGGSHGIGRGVCQVLAEAGYDIAFTYNRNKELAEQLCGELSALGVRCLCRQASLQQDGAAEAAACWAVEALGGVDVFVSNAGVTKFGSFFDADTDFIDFLYKLDYRPFILGSRVVARHMVDNCIKGCIITIASTRGIRAYPEDAIYGGMKAALIRSMQSIALELSAYGIRVNCIAPGSTATDGNFTMEELTRHFAPKIPAGRLGTPREVGHLVKYMVSDEASYLMGAVVPLDGGLILPGMPEDPSPEAGYGWNRLRFRK